MKKGFTILEVIVVIGLIIIILGVVLANLPGVKQKGTDATVLAESHRLSLALEKYHAVCGQYPQDLNSMINPAASNGCPVGETFATFLGAEVDLDHEYKPLGLEEASGVCDLGYVLAFPVVTSSSLLDEDDDYVLNPAGTAPYLCNDTGGFNGDDSLGLYDIVSPASLKQ